RLRRLRNSLDELPQRGGQCLDGELGQTLAAKRNRGRPGAGVLSVRARGRVLGVDATDDIERLGGRQWRTRSRGRLERQLGRGLFGNVGLPELAGELEQAFIPLSLGNAGEDRGGVHSTVAGFVLLGLQEQGAEPGRQVCEDRLAWPVVWHPLI